MIRIGREIQCLPYAGFLFFFYFFIYHPPPKKNIGPMIRIGREIQCLPFAGFFFCSQILRIKSVAVRELFKIRNEGLIP